MAGSKVGRLIGANKRQAAYVEAAKKIGTNVENVIFLDDNYNADKTAKSAGMKVCGVFDASSEEYTEEIKSVSDHYINNFSELTAFL